MRTGNALFLRAVALLILAVPCVSCAPRQAAVAATDAGLTSHESCAHSCDRDYAICNDQSPVGFKTYGEPRDAVGVGAACNQTLKDCLSACKFN